jgi:TonB family protein
MPWGRFFQSAVLHASALVLIWALSLAWLRQQNILAQTPFDRSSLLTYSPEEYLPPLDTGTSEAPKQQAGDPVYAKQPILSVPPEADNRTQTIVVPPDLKLSQDVPLPNIVAVGTVAPMVPLDATRAPMTRIIPPEAAVVAPAPEVDSIQDRVVRSALTSEIVAPPPEVSRNATRAFGGPDARVIAPPPELPRVVSGRAGQINIGPSAVVAPAPQLAMAPQHTLAARGMGGWPGSGQPVAPPPSVGTAGGVSTTGRLIALGMNPVIPTGPVAVPGGNRRGTFEAGPDGKAGALGTPRLTGSNAGSKGSGSKGNGGGEGTDGKNNSLPPGLHVGAVHSHAVAPVQKDGPGSAGGDGGEDSQLMAKANPPRVGANAKPLVPVADDKVSEMDRQVFGDKRIYPMTLNMPNLNSSTGSWVMHFAELKGSQPTGELLGPAPMEKSDPGYPLELIRENVHGSVTLYAVIHSDGRVGDIRVLSSPDERLNPFASSALARWKFLPALRNGKPVALEAVVVIPFRSRRDF